ncbi:primosomal protein N' [Alphaproteobacteria bacterium]|nr:primosomal protein N' [Alphaproteobacteria bacterium]
MNIIYVLLPIPTSSGSYAYQNDTPLAIGSFVKVPLGPRTEIGIVWEKTDNKTIAIDKIKYITEKLDTPPLNNDLIKIVKFISGYNLTYLGLVLKMILPNNKILLNQQMDEEYSINDLNNQKITSARKAVIDKLKQHKSLTQSEIKKYASTSVIKGMLDKKIINKKLIKKIFKPNPINPNNIKIQLNDSQSQALEKIKCKLGKYSPILLDGITGSGKTEVYFELIADIIKNDAKKQILVLLPEIALSSQWSERFEKRFGVKPCLWHSEITQHTKQQIYNGLINNTINVVVGARSALFLPFNNLALIVIDEEHDNSYKQEETVYYNARDIAIYRASINKCSIILASATPSLESWANVNDKKYTRISLTNRYGNATLPDIQTIDITKEKLEPQKFISETLHQHIDETLNCNQQVLLFLNRKGYAPLTLCNKCGFRHQCNNCRSWLVEHKRTQSLDCHHCGYSIKQDNTCPECGESEMKTCGSGVERIFEEIINRYPDAKVFTATSQNLNTTKLSQQFVNDMNNNKIDIVIGTQVIAKGYDFKNLNLVGIIDGDMALGGDDLRAGERTFQTIHQVSGRVGRGESKGKAFIQTANPNHEVIQALVQDNRDDFLNIELRYRNLYKQPPINRLIGIIISDFDMQKAQNTAKQIVINAPNIKGMKILGPTEPQMAFLRGKHRRRILINVEKNINFSPIIKQWLGTVNKSYSTRITIDVDPYSFG